MILGDFIFVHIPKTGGSSIEKAIQESWHPNESLKFMYDKYSIKHHPHSSISEYSQKVDISKYTSFTILRDPLSQIRSLYNQLSVKDPSIKSLNDFSENHLERFNHYIDQYWYTHIGDNLSVDKIFTFNRYSEAQEYVEDMFGVKIDRRRKVWQTKYTDEDYSPNSIDIIERKYIKSIELYNRLSK